MKKTVLLPLLLLPFGQAMGVYAPIPDVEKGEPVVVNLEAGAYYDSNIFGASESDLIGNTGQSRVIESYVFTFSPRVNFNVSLSDQTFLAAYYDFEAFYFENRPSEDMLFNHELGLRLAHSFSETLEAELSNSLFRVDNPETSIPEFSQPIRSNQTYLADQLKAQASWIASERLRLVPSAYYYTLAYEDDVMATILDRDEWQAGLESLYFVHPKAALAGEARYREVIYDDNDALRGSESVFLLTGVDYEPSEKTTFSLRAGLESRDRNAGGEREAFYGELSCIYDFQETSFLSFGAYYQIAEPDSPAQFYDKDLRSLFANLQYDLTGNNMLFGGVSATYEWATLNGRPGQVDIEEDTLRLGLSLAYKWKERWSVIASYDFDWTDSEGDDIRDEERHRVGLSLRYTFGLGN